MAQASRPYNTRRKSLSLPSLGIHVPQTHAARAANRDSPNSARPASPASMASPASSSRSEQPASKRLKRTHNQDSDDAPAPRPTSKRREDAVVRFEDTPPPSPPAERESSESDNNAPRAINMAEVKDEIVEAVIRRLQITSNQPHLIKELATILMLQLKTVQQSANPCAIITSRLGAYLKRPCWTESSPCPLAKGLEPVHPRRTYFYLTTCPHLPLPDPNQPITSPLANLRIISPSISSAASISEDAELDRRRELSPSPEVDLSSPELDELDDDIAMPGTPNGSFSFPSFGVFGPLGLPELYQRPYPPLHHSTRGRRSGSPPLEKDEKEFTQTASKLQKRKLNGDLLLATDMGLKDMDFGNVRGGDKGTLFGERGGLLMPPLTPTPASVAMVASPAMKPLAAPITLNWSKRDESSADSWTWLDGMGWDRDPASVKLDELDEMLQDYP